MTVQTSTNVASFNGNGVTQIFPIAFKFNNDTDLVVLLVDDDTGVSSLLTLNSDYTVSGEGDEEGGLINVVVAPAVGQRLKVSRIVDILQLLDLRNQGKFFAEVHEDAFDLLTMIAQQHESGIRSALRVPESDPEPDRLPAISQRAGKILSFDATGNPQAVAPVSDSSTELRIELAEDDGVLLVGGAMRRIASVAVLRATPGVTDGETASLAAYSTATAPLGGGLVVWDAQSTAADDGGSVFAVSGVATGRWLRDANHLLCPDDFGIVHEEVPATDQTAKVQAFLNAMSGRPLCVARPMTVGIADTLSMPSDVRWYARRFNLFTLSTFAGDTGFRVMLKHENVSDVTVVGLKVDGNQAAFGGLFPVVGGDIPRGVAVQGGCENIRYSNFLAQDVVGNAWIHLSGGAWAQSRNIYVNGVAKNCGLGFGQEVKTGSPVITAEGPGYTEYDNCWADLCNFGLYIAGGRAHLNGGVYHSKRLQAVTIYTGDAHAETIVTGNNPQFRITPEKGANQVGLIHCINKASTEPNYNLQQFLQVNIESPKFICDHTGSNLQIETGSNVRFTTPVFRGGAAQINGVVTSATGGPYKEGSIVMDDPQFTGWADTADAVVPRIPMTLNAPVFSEPAGASCGCIRMNASGQRVIVNDPVFGSVGAAQQPQHGISAAVDGTELSCRNARNVGLTGSLFNVGAANSELWEIANSIPANAFDKKSWRSASAPPTVGTWAQGDIVWNSAPVSGESIGWTCVAGGTPGTWKSMGSVAA